MSTIFLAGGALPARHRSYIEREADDEALAIMLDGEYLHLIAPRQIGKTSLLRHLSAKLQEVGWRCAYVDLSMLMDFAKADWYGELGRTLGRALTPGAVPILANQIDLRNYLLEQALPWHGKQPSIALLFDEVEGAAKAQDNAGLAFSDTFFMTLRNLYIQRDDYDGTISIAFAGATDPGELVKDVSISPFNIGSEVALDDFTWPESHALTKLLELAGVTGDEDFHQAIYTWAGGHPYLTQRICLALERKAHRKAPMIMTSQHVESVIERTILNRANPLQQDSNLKHMHRVLDHLSSQAGAFWSRLQTGQSLLQEEISDGIFRELYLSGAIKMDVDDRIVIRNRIYERAFGKKVVGPIRTVVPEERPILPGKEIRIFISSTWQDLQPEREAVERALHRMQDTSFVSMQHFGSRPDTPERVSLAEVDRSDIYVGIFAHRYGSGIAEAEYRRAKEHNLPCLIYFKDDNVPVPPAHFERDPILITKLEAFKNRLQAQHIVSYFIGPDHLATQVVADLHNRLGAQNIQAADYSQRVEDYGKTVTEPLYE